MSQLRNKRIYRAAVLTTLAAMATVALWPAAGQEQLLPPGMGDVPVATSVPASPAVAGPAASGNEAAAAEGGEAPPADSGKAQEYTLAVPVSRPVGITGPLGPASTGFTADLFSGANGRYLSALTRRLDTPVASRWVVILLRRALLSAQPVPEGAKPADWVADRALLLLRLGDVQGAQLLVQAIPVDRYTPRMYQVAAQAALAASDIGGLCPIADAGQALTDEPIWPLARAICAGLGGEPGMASALFDTARHKGAVPRVDQLLAQKVAGAGGGGRRAVNIEWAGVDRLTTYRYGLATASGTEIPDAMFATAGAQVRAWQASAPSVPLEQRAMAARVAAALGVASSASLVSLYGALADRTDPFAIDETVAGRLRAAYAGADPDERLAAIRALWDKANSERDLYAARILTARAAIRLAPGIGTPEDAAHLIAAMLSAGMDIQAVRWWPTVRDLGRDGDEAWALLAVGSPGRGVPVSAGQARRFVDTVAEKDAPRAQLFVASLVGLGRIDTASAAGIAERVRYSLGHSDPYIVRLDAAAAAGRVGEVMLLAGIGMQNSSWRGIPPFYLQHILAALKRVGCEPEARMIAAEAVTRA